MAAIEAVVARRAGLARTAARPWSSSSTRRRPSAAAELARSVGFGRSRVEADLAGRDRMLVAER